MNNYVRIVFVLSVCAALTAAQFDTYGFNFNDFATSFGAPSPNQPLSAAARDPRANRGPVLFPPSPAGDPSQTSGVFAGASGYGFVRPGTGYAVPRFFYNDFFLR